MELILQKELPHQQKAIECVCNTFSGTSIIPPEIYYVNPSIEISYSTIKSNIKKIQENVHPEIRGNHELKDFIGLDIKMETGTGKTYVYTKTIFELHKTYGLNKFIIVVPTLPIKAGTSQFIKDEYVKRHFADVCGYNCEISLGILESASKKKGKFYFPGVVSEFVKGSFQNKNKIYVLLVNMQLLTNGTMLSRDDYDYGVEGFYKPFDALRVTRPIVIIDEPHRFSKDQKAFKIITEQLKPQCIIRYGATFPETTIGTGKNKMTVKDYHNLLYDLNACDAFNQNLIKGVAKEHFESPSQQNEKLKIVKIFSKDSVVFHHIRKGVSTKSISLKKDDSLSLICDAFEGVFISAITANSVIFSNGIEKHAGEELDVDIYMTSYQEQMVRLAIQRHFETEKINFCDRSNKIKTLALFFIDDINSYRDKSDDGKEPYLKIAFESLLRERIELEILKLSEHENDYKDYLIASKSDISACHAGYFSQDNATSDEEIEKEIDEILFNKKKLLSIKNKDGSYNTRRFLFSKWTLKEGWDNPNVFTIAKLRSSGSDISKLQEVGRGLRLPVDENGNRISNEEFKLNYIVDFTEADFAERLVEQINGELPSVYTLDKQKFCDVAAKRNMDPNDLLAELLSKRFIDWNYNIKAENRDKFFEEFPEFTSGVSKNKIIDKNKTINKPVRIRKDVYHELQELWQAINQRYLLFYDSDLDCELQPAIIEILKGNVFGDIYLSSSRQSISAISGVMSLQEESGVQFAIEKTMPYNEFLKRINRVTNIPITLLHNSILEFEKQTNKINPKHINENSMATFVKNFDEWKNNRLQGRFRYSKSNTTKHLTALTHADGSPRNEIVQGKIGTKFTEGVPSGKYLYDLIVYDSPLEQKNINESAVDEVVVYGKIPRNSIAIPIITGGTYSPDFMYVVKKATGEKELNIIVETKDVEDKTELRGTEEIKINCAQEFFKQLTLDGYKVHFHTQLKNKKIKQIIEEVLL